MKKTLTKFIWKIGARDSGLHSPPARQRRPKGTKPNMVVLAQLRAARLWFSYPDLPWVKMEALSTRGLALDSYLYSDSLKNLKKNTLNPFVRNTLMVWHEAHNAGGDNPPLSCFAPIWGNTEFKPGAKDVGFKQWSHKGIRRIIDLYIGYTLMSFNEIKERFNIPQSHFFKYLQLGNFIHSKLNHSSNCTTLTVLELYDTCSTHSKDSSDSKRRLWSEDLQECVLDSEWSQICSKAQSLSINR